MSTTNATRASRVALGMALAAGIAFATDVHAQGRGRGSTGFSGKPGAGLHAAGHGGWRSGDHGAWRGGDHGRHWRGDHGRNWRGDHGRNWHGHHRHWHGWRGGHYYYPGWTLGLGVGIGLAYPWWGWGWPHDYVVVDRVVVDRPVGMVIEREGSFTSAPPSATPQSPSSTRWYCPSPAGYYPEVRDCPAGWLKVLPDGGPPPDPATPRSTAPAPRSDSGDDEPSVHIAPGTLGSAGPGPTRFAAPRMTPPAAVATPGSPAALIAQAAR